MRRDSRDRLSGGSFDGNLRNSMVVGDSQGQRPFVAHCHLGLGKVFSRIGKQQPATEHLVTAATMYREMDMRFYLERAEAEMGA